MNVGKWLVAMLASYGLAGGVRGHFLRKVVWVMWVRQGSWAASKEAKAGIDRKWVSKIGGSELRGLVDEAITNNPDHTGGGGACGAGGCGGENRWCGAVAKSGAGWKRAEERSRISSDFPSWEVVPG